MHRDVSVVPELSREQILALSAGPELDALVDEWIMGIDRTLPSRPWSTDIAAAWEMASRVYNMGDSACGMYLLELASLLNLAATWPEVDWWRSWHWWRFLYATPENHCKAALLAFVPPEYHHDLYMTGDPDAPNSIKDGDGDVVLGLCRKCGKGEAELEGSCTRQGSNR